MSLHVCNGLNIISGNDWKERTDERVWKDWEDLEEPKLKMDNDPMWKNLIKSKYNKWKNRKDLALRNPNLKRDFSDLFNKGHVYIIETKRYIQCPALDPLFKASESVGY